MKKFASQKMSAFATTTTVLGAPVAELAAQFQEANIKRGAVYTQVRPAPNYTSIAN
jgi:hypothetical protein